MSDFCKKCSIEHFGSDLKELAGLGKEPGQLAPECGYLCICEGCWHSAGCLVNDEGLCLIREAMEKAGAYREGVMTTWPPSKESAPPE